MEQPSLVEWDDLNGAWMLIRDQLPILLAAAGVDLKLAADLQTGIEATDELFRRVNSKATLAIASGQVDEEETKPEPEVLGTISSRRSPERVEGPALSIVEGNKVGDS